MTANDYQFDALRTVNKNNGWKKNLEEGLMGLSSEAGECLDILKKHLFQGHDLDVVHLSSELGDVMWYLAVSADAMGIDLDSILRMNIDKRKKRYPDGFRFERSITRDPNDI